MIGKNGNSTASASSARVSIDEIQPSTENNQLYKPIDASDPAFRELIESIRDRGIIEPIVASLDGFIISGHRRHAAACQAGLETVPVRYLPIRRRDDLDGFVKLLREYNRQRVKSFDEVAREIAVDYDPDEAYTSLIEHRKEKSGLPDFGDGLLDLGDVKVRCKITPAKQPMIDAILEILAENREYLPFSDRAIHYRLLNKKPLTHASKPDSAYVNDDNSYEKLTELLTRARLAGIVPWEAIIDETRPFSSWDVHPEPGVFIRDELDGLFKRYWRNLIQSQPNHIEMVCEKLAAKRIIEQVTSQYCIPTTTGRGSCSIDPRHKMAERFRRSGKDKLIVILASDLDPDGEVIASSFARSMRDDFGIGNIVAIKAAVTKEQADRYNLPVSMEAKPTSSNYKKFVRKYGTDAYELESMPADLLQQALREVLDRVIDVEAFNTEIDAEKQDAARLAGLRQQIQSMMKGVA